MTRPTVEVLRVLLAAPEGDLLWGARISELADLGKSTVPQILARLTTLGRVTLREEEGPHPGRPARVFHVLSPDGRRQAEAVLAARDVRGRRRAVSPVTAERARSLPQQPAGCVGDAAGGQGTADPVPRMAGHWTIRFPAPGMPPRASIAPLPAAGEVPEHPAVLAEALTALTLVNQSLAGDVLAQAAPEPAHAQQYEQLVRAIILQAGDLRRRAQRALHARPDNRGDGRC